MSTFLDQARARALRPIAALPRPRLTVVPRVAARAPRVPFVLLVVTLLLGGLVGLLLLNTSLQQGAYVTTDLENRRAELLVTEQRLELQLADLSASQRVAQQAQQLGMVSNDRPVFISLATGAVIGKPIAGNPGKQADIRTNNGTPTQDRSGKVVPVVPVEALSEATGPIEVKKPKPDRSDRQRGDANQ